MMKSAFTSFALTVISVTSVAAPAKEAPVANAFSCGYSLETGVYSTWPGKYQAWTQLNNIDGDTATRFKLLLDIGGTSISDYHLAEFTEVESGYEVDSPSWLQYQKIRKGRDYRFSFIADGSYQGITPYLISVNDVPCDTQAPELSLNVSQTLFTSDGTLTLSAEASDNVAVRKVVFMQNGDVIGQDSEAPFSLDIAIDDQSNGRLAYTATAYDPSGNEVTTEKARVFAAIGNRFLGTAPSSDADFADTATYFNQITPEDSGKWGSVEAVRDQMNWEGLDKAYNFAKNNGFPFKLHTLIWGQQAPEWLNDLAPEEQLAEIEEWMSLLAQRYPEIDMVDVVNEPLHAPPAYIDALGGAGESGWDWVIKSFELARTYFPDAQLLVNDYQILILETFSNDYLGVITPLVERGLVDGIGVQAHFLERADLNIVAKALENLASVGLPIYISEFDVNIENDAHHANRVKDLFTTFWSNPAVVGVTHWGHLQGDVWREKSYLLRADGSTRPALDWLTCFYAGASNCSVPEYIHPGWFGNASGLFLQAEEYDDAVGVAALGDAVAYIDQGDWLSFKKVNFEESWNELSFTYLKGNSDVGTVSFHLDSLDSEAILTVALEPSGGWGTALALELAWPVVSGEHDLYVRFNDVYGVANVDSIYFHPPLPEPGYGPNLVDNGDFEQGNTYGWFSWDGSVLLADTLVFEGAYSLLLNNRSGNGPAAYSLAGKAVAGASYQVSLFASIAGVDTADINLTSKISCSGAADAYNWVISPTTVAEGEWVQLSGQLNIPDCELTDVLIFAEGPAGGVDIYLDKVVVHEAIGQNLFANGDFENGSTAGWFSWDGSVGPSSTQVNNGSYALALTNRGGNGPAAYSLTALVEAGASYSVSMAASISGAANAALNITQKIQCVGVDAQYSWLANTNSVADGEWVTLGGTLTIPDCEIADVLIFLEGPAGGIDLFIDDVVMTKQ